MVVAGGGLGVFLVGWFGVVFLFGWLLLLLLLLILLLLLLGGWVGFFSIS